MLVLIPFLFAVSILISAIAFAYLEVQIEGPFGWSATTFTSHPKGIIAKIFTLFAGRDKTPTAYHIILSVVWLMLSFGSLPFVLLYGKLTNTPLTTTFWAIVFFAVSTTLATMIVEDWVWFQIHPFYGPERHNPKYVYWFRNFKSGLPITYWTAGGFTFVLMVTAWFLLSRWEIFLIWFLTVFFVAGFCMIVIEPYAKKIKRKPLAENWWRSVKGLVVIPKPPRFEIEGGLVEDKDDSDRFYVITNMCLLEQMVKSGAAKPLEEVISKKQE